MKIRRPKLSYLRNDRYVQLQTEFKDLIIEFGAKSLKIDVYYEKVYLVLFLKLTKSFQKMSKSSFTELIAEADFVRDEIFLGICEIVRGNLRHWDINVKNAAKRINILLDNYGNIAKKTLDEQTALTTHLLAKLQKKYVSDILLLKIDDWVAKLKSSNIEFESLMNKRNNETANKTDFTVSDVRKQLDNSFRKLCSTIEMFCDIGGGEIYENFIRRFNVIVARYGTKNTKSGDNTHTPSNEEDTLS